MHSDEEIIAEIKKCGLLTHSEHAQYHNIIGKGVYHVNFDYVAHYEAWVSGRDSTLELFIR